MDHLQKNNMTVFKVFPAEVWEIIVENIETTEDVQNFFKAFPALTELQKGKQFSWLIGEVMPLIMSKFLTVKDVYRCRLVSKRWRNSIASSFETHPDMLLYKSSRLTQMSEHHFNYASAPILITRLENILQSERSIASTHLSTENPFPGRFVSLKVQVPFNNRRGYVSIMEALPILKVFGQHIWHFAVHFCEQRGSNERTFLREALIPLCEGLSALPNLRTLCIKGRGKNCNLAANTPLPAFPFQLETLDLTGFSQVSDESINVVLRALDPTGSIKKLKLLGYYWEEHYADYFPNLTEIGIKSPDECEVYDWLDYLGHFSCLRKLTVNVPKVNICRILERLENSRCPLESIEVSVIDTLDDNNWNKNLHLTNVQYLKLSGAGLESLHFRFVYSLPNLKHLGLHCLGWSEIDPEKANFSTLTSQSVHSFFVKNVETWNTFAGIWEELPKLEMLTLAIDGEATVYQYARECKGIVFKSDNVDF